MSHTDMSHTDMSRGRLPVPELGDSRSSAPAQERRGDDPIIRAALANVGANLAALSASEVLQLVLFPDTLTAWAARSDRTAAQVFNMLRRTRPYAQLRIALAERLEVPPAVLNHLIDAAPAAPFAHRLAGREHILADAGITAARTQRPSIAWDRPPYPPYRDGANPLERLALERMRAEAPAMPGTSIVSLALFPDHISSWARNHGYHFNRVLSSLSGTRRFGYLDSALARRLGVSPRDLDIFIRSRKREPTAILPPVGAPA